MNPLDIMNEAPSSSFHRRLLVACCGGPFLDGYVLSIIGVLAGNVFPRPPFKLRWRLAIFDFFVRWNRKKQPACCNR